MVSFSCSWLSTTSDFFPTHEPRVSNHIEQIKDMITQIINKDFGYVVDGDVLFAVDNFPNYSTFIWAEAGK